LFYINNTAPRIEMNAVTTPQKALSFSVPEAVPGVELVAVGHAH